MKQTSRHHQRWFFGYGSLIWRPDIPFLERRVGYVRGYKRRFWQGSPDHRGVPELPGRVVTLAPEEGGVVWGAVYAVSPEVFDGVVAKLDHREKGGYERREVDVLCGAGEAVGATMYVAGEGNAHFLGPASIEAIAARVIIAVGPSGGNVEYVLELARALEVMGGEDGHVSAVAREVKKLLRGRGELG